MGYELKMYVVNKHEPFKKMKSHIGNIVAVGDNVYSVYASDFDPTKKIYYPDGNTETEVGFNPVRDEGSYCSIIGMIELCKCNLPTTGICEFLDSDGSYMYGEDGNSLIGMDRYGSYRSFVPIDTVIAEMEAEQNKEGYRRFAIALAMLKAVKEEFKSANVGCLFFGH